MDVIILAGGKGSRLEEQAPKALSPIKGRPLIQYQLDYFAGKAGRIILALGYNAGQVIDHVLTTQHANAVDFSIETTPLGTAGALRKALQLATSEFVIVLNCDDLTDIDLEKLKQAKESTICVAHPRLPFGLVTEKDGFAVFLEKPVLDVWVSSGWYVLHRRELLQILPEKGSLEYDVFPKIKLRLHKHAGFWRTANTKKDFQELEEDGLPDGFNGKPNSL